jgi:3'(2'), 5'-bisphosphate nucleotidase
MRGPRDDHQVAQHAAGVAAGLLVTLRADGFGGGRRPAELRARGDRQAHEAIVAELAHLAPGDAVLSEEGRDDPARLDAGRVWIVDPLDGTREFGEAGRSDWAVHVALWQAGMLAAGAVALPALGVLLSTAEPPVPPPRPEGPIRLLVSRTRPPALAERISTVLDLELVPMGSAGAKAMAVVRGDADVYAHSGGQYEWDSAAPVAVAVAAGLHASRLDGSALRYNQPDPWLPDLLICRPELAATMLEAIRQAAA